MCQAEALFNALLLGEFVDQHYRLTTTVCNVDLLSTTEALLKAGASANLVDKV